MKQARPPPGWTVVLHGMDTEMQNDVTPNQIASLRRFARPLALWSKRGLLVLLALNAALLVYYICVGYQSYFHSDAAVKNLIAGEMMQTRHYFPPEWNHVNGDLMVVFGHLFILPLLWFAKNGYALHAASGIVSSVLIIAGAWLVSGVVSRSRWTRLLFVGIVSSGISEVVAEGLYGQVSYGAVFYIACFAVYFAWRFLQAQERGRWLWGGLVAGAMVLAFWANPQRATASYGLPLAVATIVYISVALGRVGLHWNPGAVRGVWLLLLLLIGGLLGTALHQWILAGVNNAAGAGNARWLTFDGLIKNAGYTIQGLLGVLGGVPVPARPVISAGGIYEGIRLLAGCGLLLLIPVALARTFRDHNDGVRFVAVFAIVSMSLFIFMHVTTTIPDMTDPTTSARYLVPAMILCLLLLVVTVMDSQVSPLFRLFGAGTLLVLVTSVVSPNNPLSRGLTGIPNDPRQPLIELLESKGLQYGYASYWNAGVLSIISDEKVRVRQVQIEQGLPIPMRHLSSDRWYESEAWTGKTFLLLTDVEAKGVNWGALTSYAGLPLETHRHDNFGIYVFQRNLAEVLPNWNVDLGSPLDIRMSSATFHTVGKFIGTGAQAAMVATQGESGYVHFGPYLRLLPGRYRATFEVETAGTAVGRFGIVDVTSQQGSKVHASRDLANAGRQKLELEFALDRNVTDLELRVLTSGAGELKLHGITLAKQM